MIYVSKIFLTKLFLKNLIFSKIFFSVWLVWKNYEKRKSKSSDCRWNPTTSGHRCRIPTSRLLRIRPDQWLDPSRPGWIPAILAKSGQINGRIRLLTMAKIWSADSDDGDLMSPDSSAGRFSVTGCCQILRLTRFQRLIIAEFRQSNIKCAWKDEEFNFEKRFTVSLSKN
jgi:hypothetical protein